MSLRSALRPPRTARSLAASLLGLLSLAALGGCSGGGSDPGSGGPTPPTGSVVDTDRDGMSDEDEATPRTIEIVISVAGNAAPPTVEIRTVVGDPTVVDADGDGVDDATELRNGSDPHAVDTDGDGRTDAEELRGYRILVDAGGWGTGLTGELLERRDVKGDPARNDGDGDGLLDDEEFELRTDPLAVDTDGDTLSDYDEWTRWWSSPVSADSDEDARGGDGSQAPNASLFDGNELVVLEDGHASPTSTSPTLADTDGDGVTDADEFDTPFRKTLVADVPRLQLEPAGDIDLSLFVTYAESQGQATEYGTSLAVATSTETSVSSAFSTEASYGTSETIMIGGEVKVGFPEASVTGQAQYTTGSESSVSSGSTYELTETAATSVEQTTSKLHSDSLEKTREAAYGRIRMGMRVRNPGRTIAYRVTNLGVTVLRWRKAAGADEVARFQAIATLRPQVESIVLSPGAVSPVLTLESDDLPADTIEEFLKDPSSLRFEAASFDLENAEGIDFRFLTENTFTQTAMIEIDKGEGTVERHLVATNVDRLPGGVINGIRLGDALESVLGKAFETQAVTYTAPDGSTVTQEVLHRLDGKAGDAPLTFPLARGASFWAVGGSRPEHSAPGTSFADIRLRAGDVISLAFVDDHDEDGLAGAAEQAYGAASDRGDTDGDNLDDATETVVGWFAGAPAARPGVAGVYEASDIPSGQRVLTTGGYPRRVWSSPLLRDTDGDGLADADEQKYGCDPTVVDTDGDGLADGLDPFPLIPALRLHVDASAPARDINDAVADGLTWDTALPNLADALTLARRASDATVAALMGPGSGMTLGTAAKAWRAVGGRTDANAPAAARSLVGEIWVATGTYDATQGQGFQGVDSEYRSFDLVDFVGVYGGFLGRQATNVGAVPETRRAQREADPVRGGTVLTGNRRATHVVTVGLAEATAFTPGPGPSCILDGFVIEGSWPAPRPDPRPFYATATGSGGGLYVFESSPTLTGLVVRANTVEGAGGGLLLGGDCACAVTDCVFAENAAGVGGGGIALLVEGTPGDFPRATFTRCRVQGNVAKDPRSGVTALGGGVFAAGGSADLQVPTVFDRCQVLDNQGEQGGGVYANGAARLVLQSCEIVGNTAIQDNGALFMSGGLDLSTGSRTVLLQCLVAGNQANTASGIRYAGVSLSVIQCTVAGNASEVGRSALDATTSGLELRNSIFADGPHLTGVVPAAFAGAPASATVRFCLFESAPSIAGFLAGSQGNQVGDPRFSAPTAGDYRPSSSSPAVDAGNAFIDFDPLTTGSQGAPDTDLVGAPRVVAGTGAAATPSIDLGAYERQP